MIELIKDRDYFFSQAKKRGDGDSWNIAKYLRNITNSKIRQAKREFVLNELTIHENDPKKFWKTIHKVIPSKKDKVKQDILLKDNETRIGRDEVAHFINEYSINVGRVSAPGGLCPSPVVTTPVHSQSPISLTTTTTTTLSNCPDSGPISTQGKLAFTRVINREVHNVVRNINTAKSSGLDEVSSFILKKVFTILLPEVTFMMNLSILSSSFPDAWKKALIEPIPKSGNLTQVKNYRPISLLPLPGKILEKIIHAQLSHYLESNYFLTPDQHGFRKSHSTIHSIAQLTGFINSKLDSGLPVLAAFIDFRKAFDCVQHPVLIRKLRELGLGEPAIDWISNYLADQKQRVYANNCFSSFMQITQGVPQGSVLGPLFYIIYANDLSTFLTNCKIAMYADDTVLYTANRCFEDSIAQLQKDMSALSVWCKSNGITANTDKTKIMVFGSANKLKGLPEADITFEDVSISSVTSYKYLGLNLDDKLNYKKHVKGIVALTSGKLKQFQRMRSFLTKKAAITVYKSMLLPLLEYGDVFLSAASLEDRKKLQTLQNKGLRCALNKGMETSSEELHLEAGLLKLRFRREQHVLNYMYDISQTPSLQKQRPAHAVRTRSHKKRLLKVKRPNTEKFKKSFAYRGPKKWNSLPENFHATQTKITFKTLVANRVKERAFGRIVGDVGGADDSM